MAEQRSGEHLRDVKDQKVGDTEVTIHTNEVDKRREVGDWRGEKAAKRINRFREGEDVKEQENSDSEDYIVCRRSSRRNESGKDREFGRYTNRNDYFAVSPWDLHRDKDLHEDASYDGGEGGGGGGTRQMPIGIPSNNGGEVSVKRVNSEAGSSHTARSYNASNQKVIDLEQKVSAMQKEQQTQEEELQARLEVERKHVAELHAKLADLAEKMTEHARFSEQFSAFMRQHQPGPQPDQSPPPSS